MLPENASSLQILSAYRAELITALQKQDLSPIQALAQTLREAWASGKRVYLCGNGGSAANAMHIANDLIYGVSREDGLGLRVHALPSEGPILTCLANDEGYEHIFSKQLAVQAESGDVLIALSGSGNSPNIVNALKMAREKGMKSFAILGYSGGASLKLADVPIHFAVDDMQISEDAQLVVGHMLMKYLCANPVRSRA